ncbi:MAG TPA: hypothetical protein VI792_05645 [Candidatus Eisenbacteria bacterium]
MRALAALLILAAGLEAGCSSRPHSNPFDPANPATGGKPAGFQALAGDGHVTLRWQTAQAPGLLGYQAYRSLSATTGFTVLSGVLPVATDSFPDRGLLNGTDHYYRLYYVFDRGLGSLYASDVATPGPVTPWVSDPGFPALLRVTADGRHIAEGLPGAVALTSGAVAVDAMSGAVWTCDPDQGGVTDYQPTDGSLVHLLGPPSVPVAVAVDTVSHDAWIGDDNSGIVARYTATGSPAGSVQGLLDSPIGLAVDPNSRSVWICERTGSRVSHADVNGVRLAPAYVINPSRVAVDAATGDAWVTCFTRSLIVHVTAAGVRSDSVASLAGPLGIAVDAARGRIWVTDPSLDLVAALRRDGSTEFQVRSIPGAFGVAVDPATGEAWVTSEAASALLRISPAGAILRVLGGLGTPADIALDPGSGAVPRPAVPPAGALPQRTTTIRVPAARPAWETWRK